MDKLILATILGTPMKFKIDRTFAKECLYRVGDILHHSELGPLRCEEIIIDNVTRGVSQVVFVGTSTNSWDNY